MTIKYFIGAGLVSMSLITTSAKATDWSGIYLGGHAGQSFFSIDSLPNGNSNEPTGYSGGLHAGYQLQLGSFIIGVEGSYSALNIDDFGFTNFNNGISTATPGVGDTFSTLDLGSLELAEFSNLASTDGAELVNTLPTNDLNSIDMTQFTNGANTALSNSVPNTGDTGNTETGNGASEFTAGVSDIFAVAARGGYAFGKVMTYGKIGYATAGIGYRNMLDPTATSLLNYMDRESGLLLGAGTEFAITDRISIGVDYTYINFEIDSKIQNLNYAALPSMIEDKFDSDHHQVNVRLNFRFN